MDYKVNILNVNTASLTPVGAIIHNDAGSMTPFKYIEWLKGRNPELGFAHYYINRNETYLAMSTNRVAWHCGNSWGNGNLLSYEVCQSLSATNTDFLANEEAVFIQVAKDFKLYGISPTKDTVRLHKEYFNTSCPHRSWDLHGQSTNAVKNYFIGRITHYMQTQKVESPIPKGGISIGTNVYVNEGALASSSINQPSPANSVTISGWVTDFIGKDSRPCPYEITKNGKVIGYTSRANIARVNQIPTGDIPEGSNVICNKMAPAPEYNPQNDTGLQTYWAAQYVDGNKNSPYRLLKNGMTAGYTNSQNLQALN